MLLALPFVLPRFMPHILSGALLAALLVAPNGPAFARDARGDVARGRVVAETQCGECHTVGYRGPWLRKGVASFPAIAGLPSTTALSLRVTLRTSHNRRRMPHLLLSPADTDDVIAYMLSLARK